MQIQILFQSLSGLFTAAPEESFVDFMIIAFWINLQISIAEYGSQANLSGFPINAAEDLNVCQSAFSKIAVTGVDAIYNNGPVTIIA